MVGRQDADDVTQQVFLQVLRKIGQFSGQSQLATWLYRVGVNECLQHLRRSGRHRIALLEHDPVYRFAGGTQQSEHAELLERSLQRLDPDLRALFLLREVENLSYREIASALDVSEGTVASRLNRARRLLRQYLVELGWNNDDERGNKKAPERPRIYAIAR
jgi:RNA polymerase sigma-70 factor (ECF subfamily)